MPFFSVILEVCLALAICWSNAKFTILVLKPSRTGNKFTLVVGIWGVWYIYMAYFRYIWLYTTHNALFEFLLVFSYSENFKFVCCLREFHLWIALNLLKYALFWSYCMHALLSKICLEKYFLSLYVLW